MSRSGKKYLLRQKDALARTRKQMPPTGFPMEKSDRRNHENDRRNHNNYRNINIRDIDDFEDDLPIQE